MKKIGTMQTMYEIGELREKVRVLQKMRDKTMSEVREQVKREIELETIAKRIINFIKSNGVEVIVYPKLPIVVTVKSIDPSLSKEENFSFLSKLNDFVNLNLDNLISGFRIDTNKRYFSKSDDWVYSIIQVTTSLEDNLTLMKYLIRLSNKEDLISINDRKLWVEEIFNTIIEK